MDIKDYRIQIDRIDKELLALLEERFDVSEAIGAWKREQGLPVLDAKREKEKIRDMELAADKAKSKYIVEILKSIMAESRNYQAAQGPAYGVLGRKLPHTFSPQLHAEFGDYEYGVIEKEPEELEAYMTGGSFRGINVTIPYKKDVIPYCHELSDIARATGSVNTIYIGDKGKLIGDNTDYYGFCYMIKRAGIKVVGKKALILGSGGVSGTVHKALKDLGAREIVIISRTGENNYENIDRHSDAEIIVNTTPVGMFPDAGRSVIKVKDFPKLEGLADLIYNPIRTKLVRDAEKAGIKAIGGLSMLAAQGAKASSHFGGRQISEAEIEAVTRKLESDNGNIVIIGMPGAGKTSVGRKLAELLDKEFIDADEYLQLQEGRTTVDIINTDGMESFRQLEIGYAGELMKNKGYVIAMGGGVVERVKNYDTIRENGYVIHLKRALEDLPTDGRPVSQKDGVQSIYNRRFKLYEKWSDVSINNTGIEETASKLARLFQ